MREKGFYFQIRQAHNLPNPPSDQGKKMTILCFAWHFHFFEPSPHRGVYTIAAFPQGHGWETFFILDAINARNL
jgi:hypothetical protein